MSWRAIEVLARGVNCGGGYEANSEIAQSLRHNNPINSVSYFSDQSAIERILQKLNHGESVALVSDAGTPLISDPGYGLVAAARSHGMNVIPIPGPSALIAALSVAGLPTDRFIFEGFLPAKAGARDKRLMALATEQRTMIFYEAPHRINAMLESLCRILKALVRSFGRELTKKFEQHFVAHWQRPRPG